MDERITTLLLLAVCLANAVIDVPLTVKDTSGFGANEFPTSVVIPLPYGQFQSTSTFRMTDSSLSTVPCQFEVLTRWYAKDNSIREVLAHFAPTVAPYAGPGTRSILMKWTYWLKKNAGSGTSIYHFRTDGTGNLAPSNNAVSVTESTTGYTIGNGLLSLEVSKSNSTLPTISLNGKSLLSSR